MTDVLTLGETLAALRTATPVKLGGSFTTSVAGAESNVAIGLARLGHRSRWVGAVGNDQLGELVLRTLHAEGVETVVRRGAGQTGIIVFEHRLPGVARVDYHRTASAGSTLDAADVAAGFDPVPRILHVTGITLALGAGPAAAVAEAVRLARQHGVTVCLDVNHRSRLWSSEQASAALGKLVPDVDILIASDDELELVADGNDHRSRADALLAIGVHEVVVKHGADGATVHLHDGSHHAPARRVTVVDTIGAGDAFVAGYLSGLLDRVGLIERLHRATTLGAFAVASHGDWEGLPTRAELPLLDTLPGETLR